MKVLAVFATQGRNPYGQFHGTSNRVFEIERLDETAILFMEGQLQMEGGDKDHPDTVIERALVTNVIRLEA